MQPEIETLIAPDFGDIHSDSPHFGGIDTLTAYTLEIIEAAMQGRIDLEKDFKLKEYVASIDRTRRLEGLREAKRAVHVTDVSDDEDSVVYVPTGSGVDRDGSRLVLTWQDGCVAIYSRVCYD